MLDYMKPHGLRICLAPSLLVHLVRPPCFHKILLSFPAFSLRCPPYPKGGPSLPERRSPLNSFSKTSGKKAKILLPRDSWGYDSVSQDEVRLGTR